MLVIQVILISPVMLKSSRHYPHGAAVDCRDINFPTALFTSASEYVMTRFDGGELIKDDRLGVSLGLSCSCLSGGKDPCLSGLLFCLSELKKMMTFVIKLGSSVERAHVKAHCTATTCSAPSTCMSHVHVHAREGGRPREAS